MHEHKHHFTIGIIMQSPDMGGAETYMLSLVKYFLKEDVKIFLASNKEKFLEKANEYPIKTSEIPFLLDIMGNYRGLIKSILLFPIALVFYSKLLKTYKDNHVDVILMSGFTEKLFVTYLSVFFHIPVVWIEYGRLETIFRRNFSLPKIAYQAFNDIPKKVIVPSRNTLESLQTEAKVPMKKLLMMPLGIPIGKKKMFPKAKISPDFKNKFIIGNVSRLTTEKGQDYLIKAMPYIIKQNPQVHLLIIGDGPDKNFYHELIVYLGLEDYVTLTGFVKNLSEYYSIMDIFVFPTVWELEGFGLVTPEAMSYKIPIIASNIGPVSEIVEDGKTGILVPPKDEKAIAEAIEHLLKDPNRRKKLGENGYEKMRKEYDITKNSKKVLEVLKTCQK